MASLELARKLQQHLTSRADAFEMLLRTVGNKYEGLYFPGEQKVSSNMPSASLEGVATSLDCHLLLKHVTSPMRLHMQLRLHLNFESALRDELNHDCEYRHMIQQAVAEELREAIEGIMHEHHSLTPDTTATFSFIQCVWCHAHTLKTSAHLVGGDYVAAHAERLCEVLRPHMDTGVEPHNANLSARRGELFELGNVCGPLLRNLVAGSEILCSLLLCASSS